MMHRSQIIRGQTLVSIKPITRALLCTQNSFKAISCQRNVTQMPSRRQNVYQSCINGKKFSAIPIKPKNHLWLDLRGIKTRCPQHSAISMPKINNSTPPMPLQLQHLRYFPGLDTRIASVEEIYLAHALERELSKITLQGRNGTVC